VTGATPTAQRRAAIVRLPTALALLAPTLTLLAFVIAGLTLGGGRVFAGDDALREPIAAWPVFTVHPWILFLVALAGLAGAIVVVIGTALHRLPSLTVWIGAGAVGSFTSWLLAQAWQPVYPGQYAEPSALLELATWTTVAATLVLWLNRSARNRVYRRLRALGLLAEGQTLAPPLGLQRDAGFALEAPASWHWAGGALMPPGFDDAHEAPVALSVELETAPGTEDEAHGSREWAPAFRDQPDGTVQLVWEIDAPRGDRRRATVSATLRPGLIHSPLAVHSLVACAQTIARTFRWVGPSIR